MKQLFYLLFGSMLLAACGSSIDPEVYLEEQTGLATSVDDYVGAHLPYKTMAEYKRGSESWNVQVGYINGKPAIVKMMAADQRQQKWWLYTDSSTGKVVFMKEETRGADGKGVRNLFAYKDTSLIVAKAGADAYKPLDGNDFRMNAAAVNKMLQEVIASVDAERTDLSKAANEARNKYAQFFASGNEPAWSLVINPGLHEVLFTNGIGAEAIKFGYSAPDTGPLGESVYDLRSADDKIKITIASKWCTDASGKVFPYSVVINYQGKAISGCGILLQ
jgi:uncharacterized membrane protein